jgi:hypothetical protein
MRRAIAMLMLALSAPAYAESCKTSTLGLTYCDNGRMFKTSPNGLVLEYGTGNMWKKDSLGNTYEVYGNRPDATLPPALITPPYEIENDEE